MSVFFLLTLNKELFHVSLLSEGPSQRSANKIFAAGSRIPPRHLSASVAARGSSAGSNKGKFSTECSTNKGKMQSSFIGRQSDIPGGRVTCRSFPQNQLSFYRNVKLSNSVQYDTTYRTGVVDYKEDIPSNIYGIELLLVRSQNKILSRTKGHWIFECSFRRNGDRMRKINGTALAGKRASR